MTLGLHSGFPALLTFPNNRLAVSASHEEPTGIAVWFDTIIAPIMADVQSQNKPAVVCVL